jgi:hypothetical protein
MRPEKPTLTLPEDEPTRAEVNAQTPDFVQYIESTRRFFRNRRLENQRPQWARGLDRDPTDLA